jgi:cytochrome c556
MMKKLALALAASVTVCGLAWAEGPNPIEVRQAGQDLLSGTFTGIRTAVAAKADLTKLQDPAKAMARWMGVFVQEFPPGSDKGNTKALPAVWSDRQGFEAKAKDFQAAAEKLAEVLKTGDAAAAAAQVKAVGDACGACHRTFKAR